MKNPDKFLFGIVAAVMVRTRYFSQDGLFGGSDYSDTFDMTLRRINEQWRIFHVSDSSYWSWCWEFEDGCP